MAWLTAIGPAAAQTDYRLTESAGCGPAHEHADAQVDYRTETGKHARLMWFGGGLADVGLVAGQAFGDGDKERARALMDGLHPQTGEVLVKPKPVSHPASQLPAGPLLKELTQAADAAGVDVAALPTSTWARERVARMQRGLTRSDGHRVPLANIERLADALPSGVTVDLDRLYGPNAMAAARAHRDHKVRIGDRGFDLTLDIPKSPNVVWALGDADTANALQGAFRAAVYDTLAQVEKWCGYAMRGQHGGGRTARRIPTSGLLGWVMWHDVARPVHGQAPDPHLHAHAVIAHLVQGGDGKWSTPGNGGRELHRHVEAIGALLHARFRARTTAAGFQWVQDGGSGGTGWELAGVPAAIRQVYSKRAGQTADMLTRLGADPAAASTRQRKAAAGMCREGKHPAPATPNAPASGPAQRHGDDVRTDWRRQAHAAGIDIGAMLAAARPGPPPPPGPAGPAPEPPGPAPTPAAGPAPAKPPVIPPATAPDKTPAVRRAAAALADRATTKSRSAERVVTQPRMLATVLDSLPAGGTAEHAQALADAVLELPDGPLAPLRAGPGHPGPQGPAHQSNPHRYQPRRHRQQLREEDRQDDRQDDRPSVRQEVRELASPVPVPADYPHQLRGAAADIERLNQLLETLPADHPAWSAIAAATAGLYAALAPASGSPAATNPFADAARQAAHAAAGPAPGRATSATFPPEVAAGLAGLRRHQQTAAHLRPALRDTLSSAQGAASGASRAMRAVRAILNAAAKMVSAAARLLHAITTRHHQSPNTELDTLIDTHLQHLGELALPAAAPTSTARSTTPPPPSAPPARPAAKQPAPSWRTRPYGTYTDRQLAAAAHRYRTELAEHRHIQPHVDAETARAQAGQGPAGTELGQRRQVLETAAAAEAQLPAAQNTLDRARAELGAARDRADHARAQTQRGRAALRLTGTSRAQAADDYAAALHDLRAADADHQAAAQAHQRLQAQAAAPYAPVGRILQPGQTRGNWWPGAATRDLAQLTAAWQDQYADAVRQDLGTADIRGRQAATGMNEELQVSMRAYAATLRPGHRATATADEAAAELAVVHAEQQLRRDLPPGQVQRETAERRNHHQRQHATQPSATPQRRPRTQSPGREDNSPGLG